MPIDRVLDTHLLHTFVIIAESQSFMHAASRLGVTQPAVSQSLKQLEDHLGTSLVVRRTRPLRLTMAGVTLKQNADKVLGELKRITTSVREAADTGLAQCRLGLITSLSEVFGSQLITQLQGRADRLMLRSGLTQPLVNEFLDREIDILISSDPLTCVENIERFELFRDPMLLAVPDQYLAIDNYKLQALTLTQPLIKYGHSNDIGIYTEVVLRRLNMSANVHVRYETDDTHTMINLVQGGHGWAILSSLCLAQGLSHLDRVSIRQIDNSRHFRNIYVLARKGEMGGIPALVAETMRNIFVQDVFPNLQRVVPWIRKDSFLDTPPGNLDQFSL